MQLHLGEGDRLELDDLRTNGNDVSLQGVKEIGGEEDDVDVVGVEDPAVLQTSSVVVDEVSIDKSGRKIFERSASLFASSS